MKSGDDAALLIILYFGKMGAYCLTSTNAILSKASKAVISNVMMKCRGREKGRGKLKAVTRG